MRLKNILMTLTLALSACAPMAPLPPVVRDCRLIKTDNLEESYLYCLKSDGSNWEQRIKLKSLPVVPQNSDELIVCTTLTDYNKGIAYKDKLTRWIKRECRK